MSPRPLPLALAPHRRRDQRVVDIPVSRVERDACLALERCGVDRDTIFRVVLPLARVLGRAPRRAGERPGGSKGDAA